MTPAFLSGARKLWYEGARHGSMTEEDNAEVDDCRLFVGEYREALGKPWFMCQRMLERDCPIHTRWCSAQEANNARKFIELVIAETMKKRKAGAKRKRERIDPFDVLNELEIVFPTVHTMDTFQLLNNLHSFKEDNLQWSGMSDIFLKMWAELDPVVFLVFIAIKHFVQTFDHLDEAADLLDHMRNMKINFDDYVTRRDSSSNNNINSNSSSSSSNKDDQELFKSKAETLKETLYDIWYQRVQNQIRTLGPVKPIIYEMMEYVLCLGILPYRNVAQPQQQQEKNGWLCAKREIVDKYSVLIIRDTHTNELMGLDFVKNDVIHIQKDHKHLPFDTKIRQLLKAEYTFSDMNHVQNSILSAPGYVLVEEKEPTEAESDYYNAIGDKAAKEARDKDEAEAWKRTLADADDRVKYHEKIRDGDKNRIVLSGVTRPPHYPYMKTKAVRVGGGWGRYGGGGEGKKGKKSEEDRAMEKLRNELSEHSKHVNDLRRDLRKDLALEDKILNNASKKVSDVNSECIDALKKLNKSITSINNQIEKRTEKLMNDDPNRDDNDDGGVAGIVSIKELIKVTDEGMDTMEAMIKTMENQMRDVGININSETADETFHDYDKRIEVVVNSTTSETLDVTKNLFEGVQTLMDKMETLVSQTTSSLHVSRGAEERAGVSNAVYATDGFGDTTLDPHPPFLTHTDHQHEDALSAGVNDDVYASYLDSMRKSKEAYSLLKSKYSQIIRMFERFQTKNLKKISDAELTKTKLLDAKKYLHVYKESLKTQLKVNREVMNKIWTCLNKLETQATKNNAARMKRDAKTDQDLQNINLDLQQIMSMLDAKMTTDGGDLERVFSESSAMMKKLKEMRENGAQTLRDVIDKYDEAINSLHTALNNKKKPNEASGSGGSGNDGNDGNGSNSSSTVVLDPNSKTARFREAFEMAKVAAEHTDAQNKQLHDTYGRALETWYETVQDVRKQRERAIDEHTENELRRRQLADQERVRRANLIEMHRHVQDMRRYAEIDAMEANAKRRRICNGAHEAENMVKRDRFLNPQLLVVRDHFRKARLQEPISDTHMQNMRESLKMKWRQFMDGVIPSSSSLDNHGVKTWNTNFDAVMETLIVPFCEFKYGVTPVIDRVYVQRRGPRVIFASYCDALMRELILNADRSEYNELMYLFINPADQEAQQLVALSHNIENL
ncbi:hypothetical protein ElyMa_005790300 [Elysia marginata]|uniref:Uncharacterized protein n=1 Tax=Elysia marginata TaxID=1093978 RepID=A0AAV4FTJ2_9GAST|nr:hypothetical protein ElyMa_005790300 [Elysia marginata]